MRAIAFLDWPKAWAFSSTEFARRATDYFADKGFKISKLTYTFCTDEALLAVNQTHLQHDDYTDIITFDYSRGTRLSGEIWMSWERVAENASERGVPLQQEAYRVMVHGLLHLSGLKDKSPEDAANMRRAEEEFLNFAGLFHVEQ